MNCLSHLIITGRANLDKVVCDTWYLKDVELMSGKIYGLVSEYGPGEEENGEEV